MSHALTNHITPEPEPCEIEIAARSDAGTSLGHHEDHCGQLVQSRTCGIVAVADGVASPEGGGLASQRAIRALLQAYRELPAGTAQIQRITRAARAASYDVYELAFVVPQLREVRATLTAVSVSAGQMAAAHIGHGRVYLLRDGSLTQLSKDHTVAAESEAQSLPAPAGGGDRLTRSLGGELLVPFDFFEIQLLKGDLVLVCTDGLHRVLRDDEIAAAVRGLDARGACQRLISQANARGTPDNLSVAAIRLLGSV